MRFLKYCILFYTGGAAYMTLEFLWRGRSHSSMFLLGGLCFLMIGRISSLLKRDHYPGGTDHRSAGKPGLLRLGLPDGTL